MSEEEKAIRRMHYHIAGADNAISAIEKLARDNGIKVTVNFGAELAHTHDAITELQEYIIRQL